MPLVSIELGLTLPGPREYSSIRASIRFEVDTSADVESQIAECRKTALLVAAAAEETLAQQASNISGLAVEGLGLAEEFRRLKERLNTEWPRLVARLKAIEETSPDVSPQKPHRKKASPSVGVTIAKNGQDG